MLVYSISYCATFLCLVLTSENTARRVCKCGLYRLAGNTLIRCPVNTEANVRCGCKQSTCGPCSAACAVCGLIGHMPDSVEAAIVARAAPRWSCAEHDMEQMHVRLQSSLKNIAPTQRKKNKAAREHKLELTKILPTDGERFRAHAAQSVIIDLTGLVGAAATAAVRTAAGVSAAMQDDGIARPAARIVGSFVSDVSGKPAGGTGQAIPGALGAIQLDERRTAVVSALKNPLRTAPQYSAVNRASQRLLNREASLGGRGDRVGEEVLGSSNPFFWSEGQGYQESGAAVCGVAGRCGHEEGEVGYPPLYWVGKYVHWSVRDT